MARFPDTEVMDKEQKNWAGACHIAAFAGLVIPLGGLLGPLLIWWLKKDESAFVRQQGIEAINFRLTVYFYWIICWCLSLFMIGFFLMPLVVIFDVLFTVIAAMRTLDGKAYRYPLTLRLIRQS